MQEQGSQGEPLYLEVSATFQLMSRPDIICIGGRYGLGSKEFTPNMVLSIYENLKKDRRLQDLSCWIGMKSSDWAKCPSMRRLASTLCQAQYASIFYSSSVSSDSPIHWFVQCSLISSSTRILQNPASLLASTMTWLICPCRWATGWTCCHKEPPSACSMALEVTAQSEQTRVLWRWLPWVPSFMPRHGIFCTMSNMMWCGFLIAQKNCWPWFRTAQFSQRCGIFVIFSTCSFFPSAEAYFEYDAKKSGGVTISHLRFGPKPIYAPSLGSKRWQVFE